MSHLVEFIQYAGYFGYLVLFLIIFLESFPPTFFLPGDSLLFVTGFFASQGIFNPILLVATLFIASILGYMFSYAMGEKLRNFILRSNDKYWFKRKHLDYTENFYAKYGTKTIVLGRFVPIVRSFSPTLAGAVKMDYRKFMKFVILGGFFWTAGLTMVGYYLGQVIPNAEKFLTPIVLVIIFVSLIPAFAEHVIYWVKKIIEKRNRT